MNISLYSLCFIGVLLGCSVLRTESYSHTFQNYRHSHLKGIKAFDSTSKSPNPTGSSTKATTSTAVPTKTSTTAPTTKSTAVPTKTSTTAPTTKSTAVPIKTSTTTPTTKSTAVPTKTATTTPTTTTTAAPTTASTTIKPTPPHCTPGQKKSINGTCSAYTECDKSFKWVNKTCSTWCHNFNPEAGKCDWSWKYHCVDPTAATPCASTITPKSNNETNSTTTTLPDTTSTTTTTTTTTTTPVPTTTIPPCTNGQAKVYKKGDCKDYLQCDSGKWVKKTCSWGEDFDVNKLECRFSWWASC